MRPTRTCVFSLLQCALCTRLPVRRFSGMVLEYGARPDADQSAQLRSWQRLCGLSAPRARARAGERDCRDTLSAPTQLQQAARSGESWPTQTQEPAHDGEARASPIALRALIRGRQAAQAARRGGLHAQCRGSSVCLPRHCRRGEGCPHRATASSSTAGPLCLYRQRYDRRLSRGCWFVRRGSAAARTRKQGNASATAQKSMRRRRVARCPAVRPLRRSGARRADVADDPHRALRRGRGVRPRRCRIAADRRWASGPPLCGPRGRGQSLATRHGRRRRTPRRRRRRRAALGCLRPRRWSCCFHREWA